MTDGISEFPENASDVNWNLLQEFYVKSHPLIRDVNDDDIAHLHFGLVELMSEAKAVHHLLDMIDVPHGYSIDTRDIDARTLVAVMGMLNLRERLARIKSWHACETGHGGLVGDYCVECRCRWPCETYRMANGEPKDCTDTGKTW